MMSFIGTDVFGELSKLKQIETQTDGPILGNHSLYAVIVKFNIINNITSKEDGLWFTLMEIYIELNGLLLPMKTQIPDQTNGNLLTILFAQFMDALTQLLKTMMKMPPKMMDLASS